MNKIYGLDYKTYCLKCWLNVGYLKISDKISEFLGVLKFPDQDSSDFEMDSLVDEFFGRNYPENGLILEIVDRKYPYDLVELRDQSIVVIRTPNCS